MAHGIIINAVRRPTANGPHTEKEDFPVVVGSNIQIVWSAPLLTIFKFKQFLNLDTSSLDDFKLNIIQIQTLKLEQFSNINLFPI
jgi:hypothetical protein